MLTKKDLDRIERNVSARLGMAVVAYCSWDVRGLAVGVMPREGRSEGYTHVLDPYLASLDDLHNELNAIASAAAQALARVAVA